MSSNTPATQYTMPAAQSVSTVPRWLLSPVGAALLLSSLHAMNDSYNGFLSALMPVLMDHFGFTLATAGILAAVANVSTSLFQPVFGYVLDRTPRPPSIFVWPMITAVATCSMGIVPSVYLLIPALIVAGLSTGAFHPHACSLVPTQQGMAGFSMALFVAGGTVGYSLGPLASLTVVRNLGLQSLWVLAIPTIAVSLFAMRSLPGYTRCTTDQQSRPLSLGLEPAKLHVLGSIWMIVVLRSTVGTAFSAFLGVHLRYSGFPLVQIGLALMLHTVAGALGSLTGGWLSDRIGRKTVITLGLSGIMPAYLLLIRSSGVFTWILLPLCGFVMGFFQPVTVIMAQELFPNSRGAAAGIIMGLGWSIGGFLVGFVGAAADRVGLYLTLSWVTVLIVPAILISLTLPGRYFVRDTRPLG